MVEWFRNFIVAMITHTQTHKYTYMNILFYLLYIKKKLTAKHLMRKKKMQTFSVRENRGH